MAENKESKLITEDKVTMTGCLNALKKLRHCATCELRFDKEKCRAQKCVPSPVVSVMEFAIRSYFFEKKKIKALEKSAKQTIPEETTDDIVNDLNI